jgi:integrase
VTDAGRAHVQPGTGDHGVTCPSRRDANKISAKWCKTTVYYMELLKNNMTDMPLSAIGYDQLAKLSNTMASLPNGLTGERLHPGSVFPAVGAFHAFFKWLEASERWTAPKGLSRLMRVDRNKMIDLLSSKEQEAALASPKTIPMDDLVALKKAAGDDKRLHMMICLGLNCGFSVAEIESLKVDEVHLDDPRPYIKRRRGKTRIEAWWSLWPETVALLRELKAGDSARDAWLAPMDYLQLWKRFLTKGQAPFWTFRYYRKTGSKMVRDLAGKEFSEAYLSHADQTTGHFYNTVNEKKLHETLLAVREQLQPMFDATKQGKGLRLAV